MDESGFFDLVFLLLKFFQKNLQKRGILQKKNIDTKKKL